MTWTILLLIVGIALFIFGTMLLKFDDKKPSMGATVAKKSVKVVAIMLIAGCVCRLYVPYYLTSVNPAIVQEMVQGMQEQQNAVKNKEIRKFVRSNADVMSADAPVLGNREGAKTIYIWTDFSCPYCRRVHGELERVLADRDDVRVVVKNFSIHGPLSDAPAKAVIAAKLQDADKSAALVTMLMNRNFYTQDDLKDQAKIGEKVEKNVMKFAKEAGLDTERLKQDMNGEVVARELSNVRDLAQTFDISGTPFLIIEEQAFPGAIPYDQIIKALDK
ncbi:MAG: thioredoxin domain-containing protein [Alphaproteobacteria bacterium]|nr:thioredoxin domain-containing protein [Alphaproteobacteria bacterium]